MSENELIAVYDDSFEQVGVARRAAAHRDGLWHRSMHCWVLTGRASVLFQKRSMSKKVCPGLFDVSCGGHYAVLGGWEEETTAACCERELMEELGLAVCYEEDVTWVGRTLDVLRKGPITNRELCDVHFLFSDLKPGNYSVGADEVDGLVEMAIEDGLRLFSGASQTAGVQGADTAYEVTLSDFVPHLDRYYYRVFINARRFLAGERHLCV